MGKIKLAIAGATGFVGREFISHYSKEYDIIALSRSGRPIEGTQTRKCDLFSLSPEPSLVDLHSHSGKNSCMDHAPL